MAERQALEAGTPSEVVAKCRGKEFLTACLDKLRWDGELQQDVVDAMDVHEMTALELASGNLAQEDVASLLYLMQVGGLQAAALPAYHTAHWCRQWGAGGQQGGRAASRRARAQGLVVAASAGGGCQAAGALRTRVRKGGRELWGGRGRGGGERGRGGGGCAR